MYQKNENSKMSFFFCNDNDFKNEFFNDFDVENLKSTLFDSFFEIKNYRCKNFRFFAILSSLIYTYVSFISTFSYINYHLYQLLFSSRFSPNCLNFDSVLSRFIYINLYYRNRQVYISETEVYFTYIGEIYNWL